MESENTSSETLSSYHDQEDKHTISTFSEVNPEAKAESVLPRNQPPIESRTNFTEPDMPVELRAKIIQKLLQRTSKTQIIVSGEIIDGLVPMIPLANPKGVKYICACCSMPGRFYCAACGVTCYCSLKHRDSDSMHASQCLKLGFIRGNKEYFDSSLQRYRIMAQKALVTASLLEEQFCDAIENMYGGHLDVAIIELQFCLAYVPGIWGMNSTEAITILIFISETYILLDQPDKATFAADMAMYQAMQVEEKDNDLHLSFTKALIFRAQGKIDMKASRYRDAISNFSECVYHATEAFGTHDSWVCMGYYHLGKAFLARNKIPQGWYTLAFCVNLWTTYLCQQMAAQVPDDIASQEKTQTAVLTNNDRCLPRFLHLEAFVQLGGMQGSNALEEKSEVSLKTTLCMGILLFFDNRFEHAKRKAKFILEWARIANALHLKPYAKTLNRLCNQRYREFKA